MPQAISLPAGPDLGGDFTAVGAASYAAALGDESASTYLLGQGPGYLAGVAFDPLPGDAATVSRVSLVFQVGQQSSAIDCTALLQGLAGFDAGFTITPPEGGSETFTVSWDK